jgi:L-threonylcarbamoyladenylate synthase
MKLRATVKSIKFAASIIKKGGLVVFPTETVYGLGADALNPRAVVKVFEAKKRPRFDPLIIHIADLIWFKKLTHEVDKKALVLIEKFWPGPLTLVLLKSPMIPDIVTAGLDTVAIRMPFHPVARKLIKLSQTPIAAPSANLFGYLSPTTAEHVEKQFSEKTYPVGFHRDSCGVDLILDAGKCAIGVESTVLSFVGEKPLLLRPGGLPLEEIEKVIGKVELKSKIKKIQSPGQLPKHYAPRTPLKIIKSLDKIPSDKDIGALLFKKPAFKIKARVVEILSKNGNLHEAAANLFLALHRLDEAGVKIIYAEHIPEFGLGRAIMDRLRRASKK